MTLSQRAIEAAARAISDADGSGWDTILGKRECERNRYRTLAASALTAALAVDGLALVEGWQPIETAPINQAVLIKTNASDYYGNSGIYAAILVDMGSGRRWHTFGYAVGRDLGGDWKPTRWMLLPPAANDGEERR